MHDTWTRLQTMPDWVRAATVGIALIALALCAAAVTAGGEHRVPVTPVLQAETTAGEPAPDPAADAPTNTVVSVVEAGGDGSQSLDVSTDSSASAPPSDVSATASVEQSSSETSVGTSTNSTSQSTSEHHSSTTSGEGSTSVSVEVDKTSSNQVVTTGPDPGTGATSSVVSHISSHVGTTAG